MRLLLTALMCLVAEFLSAQYHLTVESYPATQEGLTTYRFYVNMFDPTDRMSAVYGNDEANMFIETPEGAYNNTANSSWNASGINPAFLTVFPELADDTYATIGLTGPAATSGIAGAADPAIVEDTSEPVTPYFLTDGATNLTSTTLTGCAWYVLNTAGNGLPDENMQVIILQVTTGGSISGTLNYQIFPLGIGDDFELYSVTFNGAGTFNVQNCLSEGCTDSSACNYNPLACVLDDSCTYIENGACDCNGNYLDAVGVCGGDCMFDFDGNGICDDAEIPGCINSSACNYNPQATIGDGSCEFPATGTCCGGGADLDQDGVCDDEEVFGCNDWLACNYDPASTENDDSCEYCSCADVAYTVTVEASPAIQAGLTTYRVYVNLPNVGDFLSAVYSNVDDPMEIHAPEGVYNDAASTTWSSSGINPALFVNFPNLQDDSYATIGLTTTATLLTGVEQDPSLADIDGTVATFFTQDGATDLVSDTDPGSAWFVLNGAANGYADDNGRVLIMQVTTSGNLSGTINYQVFAGGNQDNDFFITSSFDGENSIDTNQINVCGCLEPNACNYNPDATIDDGTCEYETCIGCMDEMACNYDETATLDDGTTCEYASCQGCTDGSACNFDASASIDNGTCDFESCLGCIFEIACNYDPSATIDDGSCIFLCPGCTDSNACNYDSTALQEDGTCQYPGDFGWCDCTGSTFIDAIGVCGGNCLEDADADGVCDDVDDCVGFYDACGECNGPGAIYECGCSGLPEGACDCAGQSIIDQCGICGGDGTSCVGCTYEFACNYDPEATIADNSLCEFGTCPGCTDVLACNYNPTVTIDDGSCTYGTVSVLFRVDMSNEDVSPYGVHVAGDFQGWDPGATELTDPDGDGVHEAWAYVDATALGNQIEYKFINGNAWSDPNELVDAACGDENGTRILYLDEAVPCGTEVVLSADAEGNPYCFNSCEACVEPLVVTFTVDMSVVASVSENGVHLAGSFQGWDPASTPLTDNGDGTWSVTLEVPPGTHEFKFINSNAWDGSEENMEGSGCNNGQNRIATFDSENSTYTACFNTCPGVACTPDPDPANVTFRVNMAEQTLAPEDVVYVWGGFTGWQGGAIAMSDADADGIWEHTAEISGNANVDYKYSIGHPNDEGMIEEDGVFVLDGDTTNWFASGCGVENGFGGYIRRHVRMGMPEVLDVVCFNSCFSCPTGGCTDLSACLFDENATFDDGSCVYGGCTDPEACNFSWAVACDDGSCIYEAGCENPLNCTLDYDNDGIVNCEDPCPLGDFDQDGICDEDDPCVGLVDECGVCNGPGAAYACGCEDIPDNDCDCNGNQIDAIGVCGGECLADENGNGICDVDELQTSTNCGWGTYWNEDSMACVLLVPPYLGEYGDFSALNPCYFNLDNSSSVGANDLLTFLGVYGQEANCLSFGDANNAPWSCGDPVSYQGYDYATVQIGDQCWFGENLRNEKYENGDAIPTGLSDSEWYNTTSGALAIYGQDSACYSASPDGDACVPEWSLSEYGRLYNGYTVTDNRGLCPSSWHVPTDDDWENLTDIYGGLGHAADSLKSNYGWAYGLNGQNSSGFAGLPGGEGGGGGANGAGEWGFWWSSSPSSDNVSGIPTRWMRTIYGGNVARDNYNVHHGFSVRCIKDTE